MAKKNKDLPPSPAEDMRGQPTSVRGEPAPGLPRREADAPREHRRNEEAGEEQGVNPRGRSDEERDERETLNALPDGDGPRSDRGTNPLPEHYWDAKPDGGEGR